ncbi:hypothetical protein DYB38_004002 [Aphanomyces astaci]|uniref:FAD-binding FR-type domain-containing protein n=1 Tax=Aphanomyces astaci TaxID=112090 RepID=A0A397D227_APHAT|nr:hypothetical protein DYB38_004002 [Aphanomyces astaci]RHY70240.1 hypothetical protein DYB34_002195 [Aphanomyces astaci]RHZ14115.1 hypothetical protein DYB31_007364 [Aphanomyces astaci]
MAHKPTTRPLLPIETCRSNSATEASMSTTESCAIEAPDVDGDLALRVFDSLDTIHSGVLSPALLAGGIRAAAATCRLSLHGDIDGVVGQVFFQRWHIDATQFADVVTSLPNLRTSVFDPPKTPRSDIDGNDNTTNGRNPSRLHAMWMSFQAYPSSIKVWWGLYAVLNVAVFLWKFDVYHQRKPAFNLSGYSVCIARGAAQVNLLNGFFLLWPTFTRLQYAVTKANLDIAHALALEHRVVCHIVHGILFYISGWVHVAGQAVSIWIKIPRASRDAWAQSVLSKAPEFAGKPKPGPMGFVVTLTGWTGVVMVVCSVVACVFKTAYVRSRRRNIRWNMLAHVLDGIMFGLTFVHGVRGWLEPPQAVVFLAIPTIVYVVVEVFPRYFCTRLSAVSHFTKTNDTLTLYIPKTKRFQNVLPGSFLRLHVPLVHKYEWHPFSITAQDKHEVAVQIQVSGDWTRRLYDVVHPHLYVHIDGPIPAPAVEVRQYSVALLFGAGIGITPYISVLQQCLVDAKQHDLSSRRHSTPHMGQQVYVHWQTNKQTMFKTHQHILEQVGALPNLDVQLYLTGNFAKTAPDATDVLRVLQKMTSTCVDSNSVDPISGLANLPLPTKLGRPKYHGILTAVANAHRHAEIGVFFCGPAAIKTTIRDTLHQVTTECHKAGNNVTLKYHPEVF